MKTKTIAFIATTLLCGLLITNACPPVLAEDSLEPPIFLNEFYSNPDSSTEFKDEFVEIKVTDDTLDINNYYITDEHKSKKYHFIQSVTDPQIYVSTISQSFLNNGGEIIYLINELEDSIIDSVCYGSAFETAEDCNAFIDTPVKGKSAAFIGQEEWVESNPTPGTDMKIKLDFDLQNKDLESKESFEQGETINLKNNSIVTGFENVSYQGMLDDTLLDLNQAKANIINTDTLLPGDHQMILIFTAENYTQELSKSFEITKSFQGIIINEVFPNPEGKDIAGNNEWIEIKNTSNKEININGLQLIRKTNTKTYNYQYKENTKLKPNEYFLLHPNFSITNTACSLELWDYDNSVINKFEYDVTVEENQSIIKANGKTMLTLTPTPLKSNILTKPTSKEESTKQKSNTKSENNKESNIKSQPEKSVATDFSGLIISELFPNPEGKDIPGTNEWLKIKNTSNHKINLQNLIIIQTTSKPYKFTIKQDLTLKPTEDIIIYPDFALNNSKALLQLTNTHGKIFDETSYETKVQNDQRLVRTQELLIPIIPESSELNVMGESTEKGPESSSDDENQIALAGIVTVEPNVLGENEFYLQKNDNSGGIKIQTQDFEIDLRLGDEIELQGESTTYHSEPVININEVNDIELISEDNSVEPQAINISKINESMIGSLIQISGTVTKTSGDTVYVSDGSGELKIVIKDSTGIIRPQSRKGYFAKITGILSVWDKNETGGLNYRLLPRYQTDVIISKTLANTGQSVIMPIIIGLSLILLGFKRTTMQKSYKLETL